MSSFRLSSFRRAFFAPLVILAFSTLLHAAPGAPPWAAIPATPGDSSMFLDWNAASGAVASYKVRYRTSDSTEAWTTIPNLPLTPTSYTVTTLLNQKSYEFEIGAADSGGTTTWNTVWHARPHDTFHTSGLHAGGQVNAIVRGASGFMVVGTDVGGFQRSNDGGVTWRQSSQDVPVLSGTHAVAAVAYHSGADKYYGLCGGGSLGNFFTSTDNGASWTLQYSNADIVVEPNSSNYPRKVGRLIAVDPSGTVGNTVYIATDGFGLRKSTNGGTSWSTIALSTSHLNGVVLDSGFLYFSVVGTGVYRCTTSGGSLTLFTGTNHPTAPQEVFVLGGKLYAAAGSQGIARLDSASTASATATWKNLGITAGGDWCAMDGYVSGTNHVVVVGNCNALQNGSSGRYTTVMKCTNAQASSGFTWVDLSSAGSVTIDTAMAAGNGETYWRLDPNKGKNTGTDWPTQKRLDGDAFNIDQIFIDPDDHNKIHVVGQMNIWRTLDGGTTWQPAVIGLSNAVLNCVAVDSNQPGRVLVGDSDNSLWVSEDYGETMAYITQPPVGKPPIWALAVDQNHVVYTGFLSAPGGLWAYTPDAGGTTWDEVKDTNNATLASLTSGNTVHGVAVQYLGTNRVILAAVENSGLWRLASGAWKNVETTTMTSLGAIKNMPFAWSTSNKQIAYFYDQQTGLWRSTDAGQNWTNIWTTGFTQQLSGSVALLPGTTTPLYLTNDSGLYRVDNADGVGGTPSFNSLASSAPNAGKLTTYGSDLWIACYADATGTDDVALYRLTGSTFTQFTLPYYQGAMGRVTGIAADAVRQYVTSGPLGIAVHDN